MEKNAPYQKWIFTIHLLFWFLLTIVVFLVFKVVLGNNSIAAGATFVNLIGYLLLVYGHLLWLLPRFFDKKNMGFISEVYYSY